VRDRIAPRLEKIIESRGYLVLNWGDAGWVYFFTKSPAVRPDEELAGWVPERPDAVRLGTPR